MIPPVGHLRDHPRQRFERGKREDGTKCSPILELRAAALQLGRVTSHKATEEFRRCWTVLAATQPGCNVWPCEYFQIHSEDRQNREMDLQV